MRVLITNDDGIDAPGLRSLENAVLALGWQPIIVAPAREHSQCGHRVTTHQPIKVDSESPSRHAVHGTPADCVRIALFALDIRPDLVLSGVNSGGNMGQDVFISGTVAAAREAAYHGIRAAAFSHYMIRELAVDWDRTSIWIAEVMQDAVSREQAQGAFWNINLPHLPPGQDDLPQRVICPPARSPLNVAYSRHDSEELHFAYSAAYASRPRDPGSDVDVCFGGKIAISLLQV